MQRRFTRTTSPEPGGQARRLEEYAGIPVDGDVTQTITRIRKDLGASDDLAIRELRTDEAERPEAAVIYIEGLTDADAVNDYLSDLLWRSFKETAEAAGDEGARIASEARELLYGVGPVSEASDMAALYGYLLSGEAVVLLDGEARAFCVDICHWKGRDVTESTNQTSIRGPRESFTETLRTNTSLVRRKIKDPRLRLEKTIIGRSTQTHVVLLFIEGLAKPSVVEQARSRLGAIDIDGVLDSGYIEELIEDARYSLFPTIYNTELPDNVAAQLLEGKIAIMADGTPNVLIAPTQFMAFFQSAEDYYQRYHYASLLRLLRFMSLFISLLFPSFYIAITTFHRDMLPASLLISLAAQREGVPFPAFVEALVMEVTFEILREAGVRMPRAIGQAVSVVGTLVIGQAAVQAGIVSAAMVIVVSVTAISTFTLPAYSMSIPIRILRFAFMAIAASFGLFGICMGLFVLLLHLCALRSFGEAFMSPLAPFRDAGLEDTLVRLPRWLSFKRPATSAGDGSGRYRRRW
ncbi:spore germination protein [Paenibacillus lycopersici]|uniref:Spore germination protein n=1 Tax=Paenibacillus lycopersici TaxID=2704462 RepID=A0A6C0FRC9_9BACL|nr:spore germination protein [Paenibacillus lycopersici]QHT59696.1 spore germination protein [Paenibacillus lycopersici]